MKKLVLCVLLLGVSLLVGCGGSGGSSSGGGGTTVTLVAIQVTPATPSINTGATQQFKATGSYSDGSTKDLTATANWSSSSMTVATVNTTGLATGVSAGTSTITATSGTISGNTVLTVAAPVLVSIAVTPATATVAPNGTQQFTATGTYASGPTQDITASVTWSASSVDAKITAGGLATGITPGATSTIMATSGSISGTATLTVTNPLVSIAVTPASASLPTGGFNLKFKATGTYADGTTNVDITSSVTWTSSNPAFATISNSPGTQGRATSVAPGPVTITATSGSLSGTATLTVTPQTLVSIAITAPSSTLSLLDQQQYTATGTFNPGSTTLDITSSVTWMSSDPTKVKIVVSGFATGLRVTSVPVMIKASRGAITSPPASVTVDASNLVAITITPGSTILAQGTIRAYAATGTLNTGSTLNISDQATWTSSDHTVATVGLGFVTAAASVGSPIGVMITAALGPASQTVNLTVTNAMVSSVTVTPIAATIPVTATKSFTATATFTSTTPSTPPQDVSSSASWSSDNTSVATVSGGVALGVKNGTANITASFGGHSSTSVQLMVASATLTSIAITPATTNLAPGSTVPYVAVGTYSDSTTQYVSGLATWTSSVPTVVSVTPGGVATGQSAGMATITATYQGVKSNAASVLVTQSPLASILVSPSTASVPQAVATTFTAKGTFIDGSTQDLTSNVTWASSPSSVATISNASTRQGLATGVAPGTASITAVFANKTGTATLTVTTATLLPDPNGITISPSNPTVAKGSTLALSATGHFSDGTTVPLTSQVTWTSSNPTVANINSVGQVSAANSGATTITATFTQNGTVSTGMVTLTVP